MGVLGSLLARRHGGAAGMLRPGSGLTRCLTFSDRLTRPAPRPEARSPRASVLRCASSPFSFSFFFGAASVKRPRRPPRRLASRRRQFVCAANLLVVYFKVDAPDGPRRPHHANQPQTSRPSGSPRRVSTACSAKSTATKKKEENCAFFFQCLVYSALFHNMYVSTLSIVTALLGRCGNQSE